MNNHIPISLALKCFQELRTKDVCIALITENSNGFGSCEPGIVDEDQRYMRNIFWSTDIYLIIHIIEVRMRIL